MATLSVPGAGARYSALFADLENIYYYLKNNGVPNPEQVTGELIRETRDWLQRERQEPCIIMIGYADFDQLDISLGDLYLMGLEPRTVVSTEHKNAADMRLCIDALEVLYTRPDIQTFPTAFNPPLPVEDPDTYRCLAILVNEFGAYHEVWLTPFLRRLNEEFPLLANYERQALISNLVSLGAIRVEKREGNPYPYSVAIINWNHPTVRMVNRMHLGEEIAHTAKASGEE